MKPPEVTRRGFIAGACGVAGLAALGGAGVAFAADPSLIRPPGGQDVVRLASLCIRCDRCRQACPREAIQSTGIEGGIAGLRTPSMAFDAKIARSYRRPDEYEQSGVLANPYEAMLNASGFGFCDFCMKCVDACPTGALADFDPRAQRLGVARINERSCLAFENAGGCTKCVEYCPFGAISLDADRRPVVDESACNGCGICENVCPSSTYRSFSEGSRRGINIEASGEVEL